jgi:hypothetical protein
MSVIEQIDLFISAKGLAEVQALNIPDAFAVIYSQDTQTKTLTKLRSTEIIRDNTSPQWVTILTLDYHFESVQQMVIKVFQEVSGKETTNEADHLLVGKATFTLAEVMKSHMQTKTLPVHHEERGDQGSLEIRCESKVNSREVLCVTFSATLQPFEGFFNMPRPYLKISRSNEDGSFSPVWKSDPLKETLTPAWPAFKIPMSLICNGDRERPLLLEIVDHHSDAADVSLGSVRSRVNGILNANGKVFEVVDSARKGKAGYVNSGTLTCTECHVEDLPEDRPISFTDYIFKGGEVSLIVGIDFTASNGVPTGKTSLHYIDPSGDLNAYQQAMLSVGTIVEPYDTDKKFPVYGFGAAKVGPIKFGTDITLPCFPLNEDSVEVDGVSGMLEAYKDRFKKGITLYMPTNFQPVIKEAIKYASNGLTEGTESRRYTILLMLTDGDIDDLENTKKAIIEVSYQCDR